MAEELRELRKRAGLSMRELAERMGYKGPSSIQRYENAEEFPEGYLPFAFIKKAAPHLIGKGDPPITASEVYLLAGLDVDESGELRGSDPLAAHQAPGALSEDLEIDYVKSIDLPGIANLPKDLPVVGTAVGGEDGEFQFNGSVIDYVRRPPALSADRTAFAIFVAGGSMEPRFREGELVFVHPSRPPMPGCDVIVELHGERGEPGPAYIKAYIKKTPTKLILGQHNPPRDDIEIPLDHVRAIFRILTSAELLGI